MEQTDLEPQKSSTPARQDRGLAFAKWMAHPLGRLLRAGVGVGIMGAGLFAIGGTAGLVVAVAGTIPFVAGTANICILAPILRAPFRGEDALAA